jgi:Ser/Thr protein kinase RdoA (MazF antagonist)
MDIYIKSLKDYYGIEIDGMDLLRKGGNLTYIIYSKDKKYILKEMSETFRGTLDKTVRLLKYLEDEDFPSPRLVKTLEGHAYVHFPFNDKILVLFDYIDGGEAEAPSMKDLGHLVATLHKLMDDYKAPLEILDRPFYIDRYLNVLKALDYHEFGYKRYEAYGNYLWDQVGKIKRSFCHGDLFIGNIYQDHNHKLYIMDFDTAALGFSIYDIALVCNRTNYFDFKEEEFFKTRRNMDDFLKAYTRVRTLDPYEVKHLDHMIGMYHYALQATIVDIHGLACIDHDFIDKQWLWLEKWQEASQKIKI